MPGQDERFDPTEFMTEAQLAEHQKAEVRRQTEAQIIQIRWRGHVATW